MTFIINVYIARPVLQKGSRNTTYVVKVRTMLGREIVSDLTARNPADLLADKLCGMHAHAEP
jgi:hypothetical protein